MVVVHACHTLLYNGQCVFSVSQTTSRGVTMISPGIIIKTLYPKTMHPMIPGPKTLTGMYGWYTYVVSLVNFCSSSPNPDPH
ncbi:hypothetical protein XELAEV_18002984mg [Xenopus laevis]|nr:hypothetical protein XELAEV_18002984mg [Xenopus laevis]